MSRHSYDVWFAIIGRCDASFQETIYQSLSFSVSSLHFVEAFNGLRCWIRFGYLIAYLQTGLPVVLCAANSLDLSLSSTLA
eukprot:COSAG02_NODE_4126_length_5741_cov_164.845090_2_plen_81_part_00